MPLWRIYPVAGLQDPRWEGRCIWKDVVVRAPSAAMARLVAAAMERDLDIRMRGDERLCFRSGFQDEKIYWVVRIRAEDAAAIGGEDGPNEVIKAVALKEFRCRCATKPERERGEFDVPSS